MKYIYILIILLLSILLTASKSYSQDEIPVLEGPYLGQKPPGMTPKLFAPGIVSTEGWGDAGRFSLDMNEFHVLRWRLNNNRRETESLIYKKLENIWHEIAVPGRDRMPFFSPDGNTIYFGNQYQERTETGWSEMKSLGSPYDEIRIMSLSVSNKGTYVFDEATRDADGLLRYSRLINGEREAPRPLSNIFNAGNNAHPFIAPDESYIMWDSERENGYGSSDLYISFRQPDGSWGEAINLGDKVNTKAEEGGGQITPDGKYLLFNRMVMPETGDTGLQSDLFWVDAQIIEDLRPKQ